MSKHNGIDQMLKDCNSKKSDVPLPNSWPLGMQSDDSDYDYDKKRKAFYETKMPNLPGVDHSKKFLPKEPTEAELLYMNDAIATINKIADKDDKEDTFNNNGYFNPNVALEESIIMNELKDNWSDTSDNHCTDCDCHYNHPCGCDCHKIKVSDKTLEIKKKVIDDIKEGVIEMSPVTIIIDMEDFQAIRTYIDLLNEPRKAFTHVFNNQLSIKLDIPVDNNILEIKKLLDKYEYMEHEGFDSPVEEFTTEVFDKTLNKYEFKVGMEVQDSRLGLGLIKKIHIDHKVPDDSYIEVRLKRFNQFKYYDLNGHMTGGRTNVISPYTQEKEITKFGVGMLVNDSELGRGEVVSIKEKSFFPVYVKFPDGHYYYYNSDGIAFRNGPVLPTNSIKIELVEELESTLFKKGMKVKHSNGDEGIVKIVNYKDKYITVSYGNANRNYNFNGLSTQGVTNDFIIPIEDTIFKAGMTVQNSVGIRGNIIFTNFKNKKIRVLFDNGNHVYYDLKGQQLGKPDDHYIVII